jgi:uncharacterized SAM-binding protein YcdF (DUF218 family)
MSSPSLRTAAIAVFSATVALVLLFNVAGYIMFNNARVDPLQRADAVLVLSGEHDGREDYGISLARSAGASTVVISNAYPRDDAVMQRICSASVEGIEVICLRPSPATTRGEATMMRQLAVKRSWSKIIVTSWRYHLPRARLVFRQCFSDRPDAVVMTAVPATYRNSLLRWDYVYAWQYAGFVKALMLGECS